MKILFINLPYYGHVVPTIGLVQEFPLCIRPVGKCKMCGETRSWEEAGMFCCSYG